MLLITPERQPASADADTPSLPATYAEMLSFATPPTPLSLRSLPLRRTDCRF